MSLHSHGQRLQLGRFGGEQGRSTERREQEESETRNGDPESEMVRFGMAEDPGGGGDEEQSSREEGGGAGRGERVREEELGS